MSGERRRQQEQGQEQLTVWIATVLRLGVALAAALVLAGGLGYVVSSGAASADHVRFDPQLSAVQGISALLAGAVRGESRALIQIGLLLLILTPIARVALSAVAFARQRDRLYTGVATLVLAILLFAFFGGRL